MPPKENYIRKFAKRPPKEIYIHTHKDDGYYISEWSEVSREHLDFDNIKYLRADLVVEKAAMNEWAKENLDAAAYLQLINKINEL